MREAQDSGSVSVALRLPDVVMVGAMRSGTTSLFRALADHPDVYMHEAKELHFFDEHYARGLEWYAAQFARGTNAQIIGEATPNYLYDADAIRRLAGDVPGVKVLVVLRSPVDRAYSHYHMLRARGREGRTWQQVVDEEIDSGRPGVIDRSRYAYQLDRMYAALPRDRCHILPLERLRDEPRAEFSKVCEFLGIRFAAPESLGKRVNAYFRIRSPFVRRAASQPCLPGRVRNAVARVNQVECSYEPMSPDTRRRLEASFLAERTRVIELAGWSEDPWG
jgi:sulfotransferase family protein